MGIHTGSVCSHQGSSTERVSLVDYLRYTFLTKIRGAAQGLSVEYERKCELAAHKVIVHQTSYFTYTMDAFEQAGTPDGLRRILGEVLNGL